MNNAKWLSLFLFLKVLRTLGLHRGSLGQRLRRRMLELQPPSQDGDLWRAVYRGKSAGATEAEMQAGKEALDQLRQKYPHASEEMLKHLE